MDIESRIVTQDTVDALDDEDIMNLCRLIGAVLKDEGAHWHVIGRHEAVMVPKTARREELVSWIARCETGRTF